MFKSYLFINILFFNIKAEIVPIKENIINENFLFNENKESNTNISYKDYYNPLKIHMALIYFIYSIIIFILLKNKLDIYLNNNFIVDYNRAYYLYGLYILTIYYFIKRYNIFNNCFSFMLITNILILNYLKYSYTRFFPKNFLETFDGPKIIFSIFYININILIYELLNKNNDKKTDCKKEFLILY